MNTHKEAGSKEAEHKPQQPHPRTFDSLGQENPAVDMERRNIAEGLKRWQEKEKAEKEKLKAEESGHPKTETHSHHEAAAAHPHHAAAHPVCYDDHTVAELKEMASKRGVDIGWDDRKDEIIKALQKDDKKH